MALIVLTFFELSHGNQKKNIMSGKVGTFSKQNVIFRRYLFIIRISYMKLQSYAHAKYTFFYKDQNYKICM